jgi:phage terminase Nu1 subunit (DNA packaging protein)
MPTSIEIAKFTGLSDRTVRDWQSKEIVPRGDSADMATIVRAIIAELKRQKEEKKGENPDKTSLYAEEVRLTRARADKVELEIAEKAGTLVSGEEVVKIWAGYIHACRARLLSLPTKLAAELAGTPDPIAVEGILKIVIDEALEELGSEDFVIGSRPTEADGDGVQAAEAA